MLTMTFAILVSRGNIQGDVTDLFMVAMVDCLFTPIMLFSAAFSLSV